MLLLLVPFAVGFWLLWFSGRLERGVRSTYHWLVVCAADPLYLTGVTALGVTLSIYLWVPSGNFWFDAFGWLLVVASVGGFSQELYKWFKKFMVLMHLELEKECAEFERRKKIDATIGDAAVRQALAKRRRS